MKVYVLLIEAMFAGSELVDVYTDEDTAKKVVEEKNAELLVKYSHPTEKYYIIDKETIN